MTHTSELATKRNLEEFFFIRAVCVIGGIVYPLWSFVYEHILPAANDPIERRLQLTALALFNIALTFCRIPRHILLPILYTSMGAMTLHLTWISHLNQFHPYYQIGILVLISVTLPFYQSLPALLSYIAMNTLAFSTLLFFYSWQEILVFSMACSTIFLVSAYALFTRSLLIQKLRHSREQFAASADKIESIHRDVSSMMAHIQLGVFTIDDGEGRLGPHYSQNLEVILGHDLKGDLNLQVIMNHFQLTEDEKAQIWTVISFIGEDGLQFEFNRHLLPKELSFKRREGEIRSVEIDWTPILDKSKDKIQKLLVSIRDVTEIKALRLKNAESSSEIRMLSEIISIERHKLLTVFSSIQKLIEQSQHELSLAQEVHPEVFAFIFREVHTIKGLARSFKLMTLAEACHSAEDQMSHFKKQGNLPTLSQLSDLSHSIDQCYQKYLDLIQNKLGLSLEGQHSIIWTNREIDWLKQKVEATLHSHEDANASLQEIYEFVVEKTRYPLKSILRDLVLSLDSMSEELGKPCPDVEIVDPGISFSPVCHNLLQSVFTHLLRNSLDHGIESPKERLALGKSSRGQIIIKVNPQVDAIHLILRDDGRGLDLDAIKRKALAKGMISSDQSLDRESLAAFIFLPDFSTKDHTSAISGRGVGMDAVRAYLKGFGGQIEIEFLDESSMRCPFQFHIRLPSQLADRKETLLLAS